MAKTKRKHPHSLGFYHGAFLGGYIVTANTSDPDHDGDNDAKGGNDTDSDAPAAT